MTNLNEADRMREITGRYASRERIAVQIRQVIEDCEIAAKEGLYSVNAWVSSSVEIREAVAKGLILEGFRASILNDYFNVGKYYLLVSWEISDET